MPKLSIKDLSHPEMGIFRTYSENTHFRVSPHSAAAGEGQLAASMQVEGGQVAASGQGAV